MCESWFIRRIFFINVSTRWDKCSFIYFRYMADVFNFIVCLLGFGEMGERHGKMSKYNLVSNYHLLTYLSLFTMFCSGYEQPCLIHYIRNIFFCNYRKHRHTAIDTLSPKVNCIRHKYSQIIYYFISFLVSYYSYVQSNFTIILTWKSFK